MKDGLGGKIMTDFVALRTNTYYHLMNNCNTTIKKAKGTKKCVIKKIFNFNDYKNCILNNKAILKSRKRFEIEAHNVYTEEVNKIALGSDDDKRFKTVIELHHILMVQMLEIYVKQIY